MTLHTSKTSDFRHPDVMPCREPFREKGEICRSLAVTRQIGVITGGAIIGNAARYFPKGVRFPATAETKPTAFDSHQPQLSGGAMQ